MWQQAQAWEKGRKDRAMVPPQKWSLPHSELRLTTFPHLPPPTSAPLPELSPHTESQLPGWSSQPAAHRSCP